jgi:DNA repair protein RecO (recombination protein O)
MLHHTRGIVFHQVRYSETSLIVKIYTELFGLQSYMIRGIRSKKSQIRPAQLQHLSIVDMVVYHKEKKDIQHIKELKIALPFKSIPFDIRKSSVVIFLNEVLYNVIREQEANPALFNFLYNALQVLDLKEKGLSGFHLQFLVQLTRHLGFFPRNNYSDEAPAFDLQEGIFTKQSLHPLLYMDEPLSKYFSILATLSFDDTESFSIPADQRNKLLEYLLRYYSIHIPGVKPIKSHIILQTVLND